MREILDGMGVAVATLCSLDTLGRRVRVSEVGAHAEGSAVCPGPLVARMMRGSKGAARALDRAGRELETWRAGAGSAV